MAKLFGKKESAWEREKAKGFDRQSAYMDHSGNQQLERLDINDVDRETKFWKRGGIALGALLPFGLWLLVSSIPYYVKKLAFTVRGKDLSELQFGLSLSPGLLLPLVFLTLLGWLIIWFKVHKTIKSVRAIDSVADLNTHQRDARLLLVDEMLETLEVFPDSGAHSDVNFSSIVSHVMLDDVGSPMIDFPRRVEKTVYDADGEIDKYECELDLDKNGEIIYDRVPLIDKDFGEYIYEMSKVPPVLRKYFNMKKVLYNPDGQNRDKLGKFKTLREMIASDWRIPPYEVSRPAGAYLCDVGALNTLLCAITRAGKGQSKINPLLDAKSRQRHHDNLVVNDPKGGVSRFVVKSYDLSLVA